MTEPVNTQIIEEKDLSQLIVRELPNYFYLTPTKRNIFVYNSTTFYDISKQQQENDYNVSIGLLSSSTLATGSHSEVEIDNKKCIEFTTINKNNFEIHVWSVKKSNVDVKRVAELVRLCIRGHAMCLNMGKEINMFYQKLDNTNKPMNDAVFNCDLISKDKYTQEIDYFTTADLDIKTIK